MLLRWTFTVVSVMPISLRSACSTCLRQPESRDRQFTRSQHFEARLKLAQSYLLPAAHAVAGEADLHSIDKILIPEGLRKNTPRAQLL
jgi:hypothetical protein